MVRVPDEVEGELRAAFAREGLDSHNLSLVDSTAHRCVRRVLSRRGLGSYAYNFVWPVLTVEVQNGTPDARKFVFDVRELE
jgi:hypothetical protein